MFHLALSDHTLHQRYPVLYKNAQGYNDITCDLQQEARR